MESFKCAEAKTIFNREFSTKMLQDIQHIAFRKLRILHWSVSLNDLRVPPANRLEKLHGEREGQWSIRITEQY
ncbi:MAG: type II toxin-antitoxin system RelE/ParE family toxin [Thermodesulfobacteriota bacterium]